MAKFCGKCGSKLDETTGLCPNCDKKSVKLSRENKNTEKLAAQNTMRKKEAKKQKSDKKPKKDAKDKEIRTERAADKRKRYFFLKIIFSFFCLGMLAAGITGVLVYYNIIEIPVVSRMLVSAGFVPSDEINKDIDYDHYKVEPINADEYFQQYSQIIRKTSTAASNNVLTEAEVVAMLSERGFADMPITTEYAIDGTYGKAVDVSESSSVKHPVYQTYFMTEQDELWTILIIENDIIAAPVSYKMQTNKSVELVVAEKSSVTSYDSTTNRFYETIPDESVQIVKVIRRIDAESLSYLTAEVIEHEN